MTWSPGRPVRLETENYVLRSLAPLDVSDRFAGWFRDAGVVEHIDMQMNVSLEQLHRFLERNDNRTRFKIGIFDRATAQVIGFYDVTIDPGNEVARTDVLIGERDYWGRKVVVETRAALLDFLFEAAGMHRVQGVVFARNIAAVFNYKALGFRCEGLLREAKKGRDGSRHDVYMFGMTRGEWRARREEAA